MTLRQQFYSLTHDPAVGIAVFIVSRLFDNSAQLVTNWISDKLLIELHQSWAPVRTALTLREKSEKPKIEKITSALTALPTNNDTGAFFFSASSQIGKLTDFVVTCHISSLFLSISVENRLEHVASISKSSCTASGIQKI